MTPLFKKSDFLWIYALKKTQFRSQFVQMVQNINLQSLFHCYTFWGYRGILLPKVVGQSQRSDYYSEQWGTFSESDHGEIKGFCGCWAWSQTTLCGKLIIHQSISAFSCCGSSRFNRIFQMVSSPATFSTSSCGIPRSSQDRSDYRSASTATPTCLSRIIYSVITQKSWSYVRVVTWNDW